MPRPHQAASLNPLSKHHRAQVLSPPPALPFPAWCFKPDPPLLHLTRHGAFFMPLEIDAVPLPLPSLTQKLRHRRLHLPLPCPGSKPPPEPATKATGFEAVTTAIVTFAVSYTFLGISIWFPPCLTPPHRPRTTGHCLHHRRSLLPFPRHGMPPTSPRYCLAVDPARG
jgi:hypothetical protein